MTVSHAPNSEAIAKRRAEIKAATAQRRAVKRVQRKCFWSWPWGHTWAKPVFCYRVGSRMQMSHHCVGCGKQEDYVDVA
jgi:hypothetical protein